MSELITIENDVVVNNEVILEPGDVIEVVHDVNEEDGLIDEEDDKLY